MNQIADRNLPSNLDVEKLVLGSLILQGSEAIERIKTLLRPDDFILEKHRCVFNRLVDLQTRAQHIDRITVISELKSLGELERAGGIGYVADLDSGLPLIANLDAYVQILVEKGTLRRVALLGQHMMNRAMEGSTPPEDIVAGTRAALERIEHNSPVFFRTPQQIIEAHPGSFTDFISPALNPTAAIDFPWYKIQLLTCGLKPAELAILAARPSMGKSAAALQIGLRAASKNLHVVYFSLEMIGAALVRRLICHIARVDANKMRLGLLDSGERSRITGARNQLVSLPFSIEDSAARSASQIAAALRHLHTRQPVSLADIDHFHLIRADNDSGTDERVRYARIADQLQRLARDTQIPFLVLAQLNRKCEEENRAPGLSDLKETGKLEENADLVLFLHRPEIYVRYRDRPDLKGLAELIIAKQRDGSTGKQDLHFSGPLQCFSDITE